MREMNSKDLWCPMGRMSLQQIAEGGRLAVIQAGAFNQVSLTSGLQRAESPLYLSSMCQGRKCPYYRRGIKPWGWGYCALANIDYRPWFGLVIAAAAAICAVVLLV